jgi:hypothetical protein
MGKPVVTIGAPEAAKFADLVEIAHDREEFLAKLDAIVQQPENAETVQRRIDRVATSSWEARVEKVLDIVRSTAEKRMSDGCVLTPESDVN